MNQTKMKLRGKKIIVVKACGRLISKSAFFFFFYFFFFFNSKSKVTGSQKTFFYEIIAKIILQNKNDK